MKIKEIKKDFSLYLYAVMDCELNVDNTPIIKPETKYYTISYRIEDCNEYIDNRLYDDNKIHYKQWCELRNLNYKDINSWDMYFDKVLYDNVPYKIIKLQVTFSDLLAMVRLFEHCYPIGCSFDREVEKTYYDRVAENIIKQINKESEKDKEIDKEKIVQ